MKSKYHATQVKKFPKSDLNEELEFFVATYKNFKEFYRMYKTHYTKYHHGIANTYTNLEKINPTWSGVRDPDKKSETDGRKENEGEVYSDEEDMGDSEDSDWEKELEDFEIELGLREGFEEAKILNES